MKRDGMPYFSYFFVSQKFSPEQRAILSSSVICCKIVSMSMASPQKVYVPLSSVTGGFSGRCSSAVQLAGMVMV